MADSLTEEFMMHACFISGVPPGKRHHNDPMVVKAVSEAIKFIHDLGDSMKKPSVHGGTIVSSEDVLILEWTVREILWTGLSVTFKADGKCTLAWWQRDERLGTISDISSEELQFLNIPEIYREISQFPGSYIQEPRP